MINVKKTEKKIIETIEKIKPFLQADGGDLEFIKFEDGNVYIKLLGACSNCGMIDYTVKEGIEATLVEEIPEVVSVIRVD